MRSIVTGFVVLAALSACAGPTPVVSVGSSVPLTPSPSAAKSEKAKPKPKPAASDVRQLKRLGITIGGSVLIDVADDGVDRWLEVGKNGAVDFTGRKRTDATMMSLKAAPVGGKNKVLIQPVFWNEDLGRGSCVADTAGAALKLETCAAGVAAQVWTVVPAGDSGQFELRGKYGTVRVENGRITTGGQGRTGLQTIDYAK